MSRNLNLPFFPIPPDTYDKNYFDSLVRNFAIYLDQMQQPGEGRATGFVFTNLQDDDQGLETNAIFKYDGYVRISTLNSVFLGGLESTSSVGTVTVTTT
jgi:hypothetical protein